MRLSLMVFAQFSVYLKLSPPCGRVNQNKGGAVMSELIDIISKKDKLLDFMERYNLIGLREATEEQLKEYIEEVEHEAD